MKATKTTSLCLWIMATLIALSINANGQTGDPTQDSTSLNLLPMYGYPDREKSERQKTADDDFIAMATAKMSREEAGRYFATKGWEHGGKGDYAIAMKRFNQSWLLNPDSYMPYWGFGKILAKQGKFDEAVTHFERALSLIDNNNGAKRELLIDAVRPHSFLGVMTRTNASDRSTSDEHFNRANELFSEARTRSPQCTRVLSLWADSLYWQGDYEKAWEMVKEARSLGHDFSPKFITSLSRKMPEPKSAADQSLH